MQVGDDIGRGLGGARLGVTGPRPARSKAQTRVRGLRASTVSGQTRSAGLIIPPMRTTVGLPVPSQVKPMRRPSTSTVFVKRGAGVASGVASCATTWRTGTANGTRVITKATKTRMRKRNMIFSFFDNPMPLGVPLAPPF
jgi:hypothetical protein